MSYRLDFTKQAQSDFSFHKKSGNKSVLSKIAILLEELTEHPFSGTGKPEALKHSLSGLWSRRINREHAWFTKFLKIPLSFTLVKDIMSKRLAINTFPLS